MSNRLFSSSNDEITQMGDSATRCSIQTHQTSPNQRMASINPISNQDLQLDDIPDPDVNWDAWSRFAHTINGYDVQGGFKPCADLANGGEAKTLTELRCALFFEARRDRHSGGMSTDEALIRELLGAIRQKVDARELA